MMVPPKFVGFAKRHIIKADNEAWKFLETTASTYPLAVDNSGSDLMARVLWMTDIYSSCGLCHIKATGHRYFEAKWMRKLQRMPVNVQHRKLPKLIAEFHPVITVFDPIPIERPSRPPTNRRTETIKSTFGHYIGSSLIDGRFITLFLGFMFLL